MKGRPPTPTHLRAIEGNRGKRGLETQEPEPPIVVEHQPPEHFDRFAADMWKRLIVDLGMYVQVTVLDLPKLELLCMSYSRYRTALDAMMVRKDGGEIFERTYITSGRNGKQIKTRPEYHQALEEARFMHSLMAEFGMSPASRVRLKGMGQRGLFDEDPLGKLNEQYGDGRPRAS